MTPEQILKQISAGGKAQNEALRALYETKAATFKRHFLHKGIHPSAVEDVLQDKRSILLVSTVTVSP